MVKSCFFGLTVFRCGIAYEAEDFHYFLYCFVRCVFVQVIIGYCGVNTEVNGGTNRVNYW